MEVDLENQVTFEDENGGLPPEEGQEGEQPQDGEKPEAMTDDEAVKLLKEEMSRITVCAPVPLPVFESGIDQSQFPQSYKQNTPEERRLLAYAENFRKQYVHLYRDRKPLLLFPVNECNVEKFVSTTVRPTKLPYEEFWDWREIAEFVSDYLTFVPLDPPTEIPKRLISPITLLQIQKGTSFDYATLLCSLLNGVGYDSYVVSGYATREVCIADQTRDICPLLEGKKQATVEETAKTQKKYVIRTQRQLTSRFDAMMKQRVIDADIAAKEEAKRQAELEEDERLKPPPDPLYGMRVHAWVLVLAGKREIADSFFIEPLTGKPIATNTIAYLGIESIWNHINYWVNMQDCSSGVQKMMYELSNCQHWELFLPVSDPEIMRIVQQGGDQVIDGLEEDDEDFTKPQISLPPTWVKPIDISRRDYEMRCPQGTRSILYKRAKVEKFASYLLRDGIVRRVLIYSDRLYKNLIEMQETYKFRADKLRAKIYDLSQGWMTEYFDEGRPKNLKEHRYKSSAIGPENDRFMYFYHKARIDGLAEIQETPTSITQYFVGREDRLISRTALLGRRQKKFGPADDSTTAAANRPILRMIETFARNPAMPANEDVAQVAYLVSQEKIHITYHVEDGRVTQSTREFVKPPGHAEKGAIIQMQHDTHMTFQIDPNSKDKRQVEIYNMLIEYLAAEEKCRGKVRDAEKEVRDILEMRSTEELKSELTVSLYDNLRNEDTHKKRLHTEHLREEEKMRTKEMELDFLAPFLAQLNNLSDSGQITRAQAFKLREDSLADLKQRLIDIANMIQSRFEKETTALLEKQAWYQQNQLTLSKEEEEEYLNFCQEAGFRIHILEIRLNRHKELAPQKYTALELKLRTDSRIGHYFVS